MNNPESSRDHVILCFKLHHNNNHNSLLFIGDLAGFENEIKGNSLDHVLKSDRQYRTSNIYKKKQILQ